jgi:hypothetical protein
MRFCASRFPDGCHMLAELGSLGIDEARKRVSILFYFSEVFVCPKKFPRILEPCFKLCW